MPGDFTLKINLVDLLLTESTIGKMTAANVLLTLGITFSQLYLVYGGPNYAGKYVVYSHNILYTNV